MYESHKLSQNNNWWFQGRKDIVESLLDKQLKNKKKLKILEIGSGYGVMAQLLKKYGSVECIEPYPDATKHIKNKLKLKVHTCTFDEFKTNNKYDVIALFDVLEHMKEDKKAIKRILSLLTKNGALVMSVPAYKFLWSAHDDINNHFRRYTKKGLKSLLAEQFIIKKLTYFNTFLFPLAILDKLIMSKNKKTQGLNQKPWINNILYSIFRTERKTLKYLSFPFGVSLFVFAKRI